MHLEALFVALASQPRSELDSQTENDSDG